MSLENIAIAVLFAAIGYFFGRLSIRETVNSLDSAGPAKVSIYREVFAALDVTRSALLQASMEETQDGRLTESTQKAAWDSMNAMSRLIAQTSFVLSQEMLDALEDLHAADLGVSWSDRLDQLARVREAVYVIARRETGARVA